MRLLSRMRAALAQWFAWCQSNRQKPLRQMPTAYLVLIAASSAFAVLMAQSSLTQATATFVEKVVPTSQWPVNVIVGLFLLAWWAMVGLSALMAATHGKALGDKLFDPAQT